MNMELCHNVSVSVSSGECHKQEEKVLVAPSSSSSLDDLFSAQNTEVDVGLEWLSVFVEDCFSSPASSVIGPAYVQAKSILSSKPCSTTLLKKRPQKQNEPALQRFPVPGKARSKRKRLSAPRSNERPLSIWSHHLNLNPQNDALISDPPLLKQAYWLADSELIVPKKKDDGDEEEVSGVVVSKGIEFEGGGGSSSNDDGENHHVMVVTRRCSHCLSQRTPQWRAGPLGPKTLCNACGVRYKSGRLLPEYRPAKSPTFVSYLHSNSHKKVMEMRNMAGASVLHS